MKRRRLLAVAGAALSGSAGCLRRLTADEADGPPSVDAPTVELGPGEETTVTVEAENLGSMQIIATMASADDPDVPQPSINLSDATLTPHPNYVQESYPPYWNWSLPRATVTCEVPISVTGKVPPREYVFTATVWRSEDRNSEPASDPIRVRVPE